MSCNGTYLIFYALTVIQLYLVKFEHFLGIMSLKNTTMATLPCLCGGCLLGSCWDTVAKFTAARGNGGCWSVQVGLDPAAYAGDV